MRTLEAHMSRPVTTASNLFRREKCPGSARLEAGLPEEDSEFSREGQLLHNYSAHPEYERKVLTPNQQDLLATNDALIASVILTVGQHFTETKESYHALELELNNDLISGTPDLIIGYRDDHDVLVIDYKFGYQIVERADLNLQLRVYAMLVYDHFNTPEKVFVAITQPRAPYEERITIAEYMPEDIEASRQQVKDILKASNHKDAPLVPGEVQCRYCRAKLICPAFKEAMQVPAVITPDSQLSKAAREAFLEQRLAELDDEQLEKVIAACSLAKMVSTSANDEVRRRGGTEHLTFAKDSEVREVVDVRRATSLLSLAGFERTEIFECIQSLSLTKLEELLRKKNPNWKWQDAKDWVNKKLKSVIELQTRKGRIIPK